MPPKLRRPAAAGVRRRGIRRPAGLEDEAPAGRVLRSEELSLEQCRQLKDLEVVKGTYWETPLVAALHVKEVMIREGDLYLKAVVTGTKTEEFLRAMSSRPGRVVDVHLCRDCGGVPHAEGLVHLQEFRLLGEVREAWMSNMIPAERRGVAGDELADMRADQARMRVEAEPGVGGGDVPPASPEGHQKKEKKRSRSGKKKRKIWKVEVQKSVQSLFAQTGVDPDPAVRKKFKRKAAKLARKRSKESSSGSSSSSSSTSAPMSGDPSIFGATGKVQLIGKKLPGTLTTAALEEAAESLITHDGGVWETSAAALPPLFVRYYRSQLASKMAPAMSREVYTLCHCLDLMLRGRAAEATDLLAQRVKALEMQSGGVHFTVAQQQELLPREGVSMSTTPEFQEAARRAREEGRARAEAARPYGVRARGQGKADEWPKGAGKKGVNKGKGAKGGSKKGEGQKVEDKAGKGS